MKYLHFNRKLLNQVEPSIFQNARRISHVSDDYQFIQRSKVPMLHFQTSLPRLPVPPLEKTCERYLNAQEPLLTVSQFKTTKEIVKKFRDNEGKALHEELVTIDKKNKHTSYISKPWFDMYLKSRDPVVINVNPFMGWKDDPKAGYNDQLVRASNIVISSLRFLRSLREKVLEPEVYHLNPAKSDNDRFRSIVRLIPKQFSWYGAFLFKAFPLDMSQYGGLFNSTRIPKQGQDEILSDAKATHMVVLRNGHFYVFDVLDNNGYIKDPSHIHSCLNYVVSDTRKRAEYPIASLTTLDRDKWAVLRLQLLNAGNAETLRLIDTAVFSLSLDEEQSDEDPYKLSRIMLHGDGTNRWFDKSLQVILTKDGKTAINFEHSWGDGVAVLRYMNEVFKDSTEKPLIHPSSKPQSVSESTVRVLEFKLEPEMKREIQAAVENLNAYAGKLQFNIMQYERFGKNLIKSKKLSPDAIIQLAFQMAYFKQNGKFGATYESCSTAAFKNGRTETVRPATNATKRCAEAFADRDRYASANLMALIEECSKVHGNLTKEAAMGNGFDRHLFVLRMLAENRDPSKLPEIFRDPAYASINHNILSTSTLSSDALLIAGFGPVVPDGFGIGYMVQDSTCMANITSYPPVRDAPGFIECIEWSLDEIYEVFKATGKRS